MKTKPSHITIENLNVSRNDEEIRHLSKAVASQKFYEFRTKLKAKCDENGIELRVVDRWYPSSKNMSLLWCYQERFETFRQNIPL